jgi:outer membrane receptor protein involved in Fe transport
LGPERTLVLVNGRRHIAGQAGSAAVDISTIPQELIERVEVVTGGASAVYGADAVAGVVNFILKDNFEGISLYSQAGENSEGNYASNATRLVVGSNFAEDRGNFVLSGEYASTPLLHTGNSYIGSKQRFPEIPNPADGDTPGFNDGIPDVLLGPFPGQESSISRNGMLTFVDSTGNVVGADGPGLGQWTFNADGSLRPWDYGSLYLPDDLVQFGGDGLTFADLEFNLRAAQERRGANALLSYDLTDSLKLFAELKYVNTRSVSNRGSSPRRTVDVPLDNAFWSPQALQFLTDNDVQSVTISRYNRELGIKQDRPERNTFRSVLGVDGEITDQIHFELSYVYGRGTASLRRTNNLIVDRFTAGVDAVRDPTTGQIVCRSTIDGNPTGLPAFAVDGCVPVNILGVNTISDEAVAFLMTEDTISEAIEQNVITLAFDGDTSGLFSLPGGPVGWAFGGEYRSEDAVSRAATVEQLTGIVDRTASGSVEGSFNVVEVFGELSVPLIADKPFVKSLGIDAAARMADYSNFGSNLTWSVGANWTVTPDIRFRTTYAEAVRAPNIGELFAAQSGFIFFVPDPCDRDSIDDGTQFRAANCAALGIPVDFNQPTTGQFDPLVVSGGNPDLKEEQGTTWTVGAVFTPSFLRGFTLSVDYWDIKIDDVISATSSDSIAARCVDGPSIDNSFCPLITRDPVTLLITQVNTTRQNLAAVETNGLDVQINYQFALGQNWGNLDLNLVGSRLFSRKTFDFQEFPDESVAHEGVLGDPKWLVNFASLWRWNRFSLNYELRYMSPQLFVSRETDEVNPDGLEESRTRHDFLHDIRAQFDITDHASIFTGVDNVADEKIPCCMTGGFNNSAQYDNIGRFFYGGFRLEF